MPAIVPNVGGSLTGLLCLVVAVLFVRMLRKKKPEMIAEEERVNKRRLGKLSASTLVMLIETDPVPHFVVDVRSPAEAEMHPVPTLLKRASGGLLEVPVRELHGLFQRRCSAELSRKQFKEAYPGLRAPRRDDLIVLVCETGEDSMQAVEEMEAMGYNSSVYLEGGLVALRDQTIQPATLKYMDRHAVAVLLGFTETPPPAPVQFIDVRRIDEHVVFGTIEGSRILNASELPKALSMDPDEFKSTYSFEKPGQDDVLVLSCRTNRRAKWAAALCSEAGLKSVYVHRQGVHGWRFDPAVKVYDSYELGDEIPKPKPFTVERPDLDAGWSEIEDLGLGKRPKMAVPTLLNSPASPMAVPDVNQGYHAPVVAQT